MRNSPDPTQVTTDLAPESENQPPTHSVNGEHAAQCNLSHLLSSTSNKLGVAYEQLQTEIFESSQLTADQNQQKKEIKTVPAYLVACITQLQVELATINPKNTMNDLGTAWLKVTDLQSDLDLALDTLLEEMPESAATKALEGANQELIRCACALEERIGRLFDPEPTGISNSQANRDNAAIKVDHMLQRFKCFSQMDVNPCLEKLEQEVNEKAQDLLITVKRNLNGLEDALSTLLDASLFDDLPKSETQRIGHQITQLEGLLSALKSSQKNSEQANDYISKIDEKLRLASQSYSAFIA